MNLTTPINILGCTLIVAGIGRIAIELNKAYENKIKNKADSIFTELSRQPNTYERIFHGACVIPIAGPLLYWGTQLFCAIAKKINDCWIVHKKKEPVVTSPKITPIETPTSINDISISNISTCQELKKFYGKQIIIRFPRYADSRFEKRQRENLNLINDSDSQNLNLIEGSYSCVGKLNDVSEQSDDTSRYSITLTNVTKAVCMEMSEEQKATFLISDLELQSLNPLK